jgi:dihydropteroate synthase
MAELAARVGAPLIVMAGEREGETAMSVTPPEIALAKLRRSMKAAAEAGVPHENLIVDPGVGFFRNQTLPWYEFDRELLRGLGELQVLNRPILVSASRKSFIGRVLDRKDAKDRLAGSLAIAAWCARLGANIIRTHDPAETRDVLRMGEWLEG